MALTVAPDQGWAWVIAIAAGIINMILSGISRMIGILYVAVIGEYHVSREEATLPFTVRNAIRCLAGPLVGLFGQRYGIKSITIFGGLTAALGACLCSIAPNVMWLTIFWGGLHGFGFAFANTLFQVIVNQYFEKHRATASGLALSGACLGSFGFPFMMEALLDTYDLSGSFLIIGGVVLNVLPPALLLSSPPWLDQKKETENTKDVVLESETTASVKSEIENGRTNTEECKQKDFRVLRSTSMSDCPLDGIELRSSKRTCSSPISQPASLKTCAAANGLSALEEENSEKKCTQNGKEDVQAAAEVPGQPFEEPNIHHVSCVTKSNSSMAGPAVSERNAIVAGVISVLRLYKNPVYVLISIGMATYIIVFIPILTVIVDYGVDKGISRTEGKYLINAMAIGDLIGRLGFGWVTDRKILTIPRFFTTTLVLQALFVALFPFAKSLAVFMVLLALYGVTAGSMLILFPILVLKYVSEEEQPVAMGCVGFLSGLVTLVIPFLIGQFRDKVGSYDGMFYFIGGWSLLSGTLWFLEPVLAKRLHKSRAKKNEQRVLRSM